MSDLPRPADEPIQPPSPSSTPPPPPPSGSVPPPGMPVMATPGQPPSNIGGVYYSVGLTILLTIVTLGIWGIFWTYRTNEDLKRYNRDGIGGPIGVVLYLVINVVLMFTIPHEIEQMYHRDGRKSPVSTVWGLWFLLPLIGHIIWYVKVQHALNDFWQSKGVPAT
jgi:hypothetical protein